MNEPSVTRIKQRCPNRKRRKRRAYGAETKLGGRKRLLLSNRSLSRTPKPLRSATGASIGLATSTRIRGYVTTDSGAYFEDDARDDEDEDCTL